jgi:hypothetical protein
LHCDFAVNEEPVQIRHALRPGDERALHIRGPPVPVHAVLVKKAALVVKAVREFVADNRAKGAEIARHGSANR